MHFARFGNLKSEGNLLGVYEKPNEDTNVKESTIKEGRDASLHHGEGAEQSEEGAPCVHEEEKTTMTGRTRHVRSTVIDEGENHILLHLIVSAGVNQVNEPYESMSTE